MKRLQFPPGPELSTRRRGQESWTGNVDTVDDRKANYTIGPSTQPIDLQLLSNLTNSITRRHWVVSKEATSSGCSLFAKLHKTTLDPWGYSQERGRRNMITLSKNFTRKQVEIFAC